MGCKACQAVQASAADGRAEQPEESRGCWHHPVEIHTQLLWIGVHHERCCRVASGHPQP